MAKHGEVHVDRAVWDELRKKIRGLDHAQVKVGVLADRGGDAPHAGSALSLIELAAIHEFGSPAAHIPERSFIRSTVESVARDEIAKVKERLAKGILAGKLGVSQALGLLGAVVVGFVQRTITERKTTGPEPQALKPKTIRRKGSSTPLVDTGQLKGAIAFKVEEDKR